MRSRSDRDEEFAEFVRGYRTRLLGTAYLLCGDRDAAEDLVQVALAKLYVAWPRIRRDGGEHAYVRRILVNASIDAHRGPRRHEHTVADVPDRPVVTELEPADRDELIRALAELPPRQRRVVVLRYWLDLSIDEVAADLKISDGTVKSQSAKALRKLREQLGDDNLTTNQEYA